MESNSPQFPNAPTAFPVATATPWVGALALAFFLVPLWSADSSEDLRRWNGTLEYKEDLLPLSDDIVKRSKVSLMNLVRRQVANPTSEEANPRFAEALSIETEGVPRHEWEAKLIHELSQALDPLLQQTQEELTWPSYDFTVDGAATTKTAPDGKTYEFSKEPTVNLGAGSFSAESPVVEHTAEAGPLRFHFGILGVRVTSEKSRWHEVPRPRTLSDKSPVTASFQPRYLLDLTFTISLADSPETIMGKGSIGFSGSARTIELQTGE